MAREEIAKIIAKAKDDYNFFAEKILFNVKPPYIHEGQKKLLKKIEKGKKRILVVSTGNRFGKTEAIFYAHLRHCIYKFGIATDSYREWFYTPYKTINLSFEYNRAKIVFNRFKEAMRRSPILKEGAGIIRNIRQRDYVIEFENNSSFYFGSLEEGGKHAEGESYYLLTVDEAHYEKELERIHYSFMLPRTVGVGGKIVYIGTPKPETPSFLETLWAKAKRGNMEIDYFEGSTYDNVFLKREDIERIEKLYEGQPHLKAAALHGIFIPKEGRWLSDAQVSNMVDGSLPNNPIYFNERGIEYQIGYGSVKPEKDRHYVSFWDLGWQHDWTVGITLDATESIFKVVNFYRFNRKNAPGMGLVWHLMKKEEENYNAQLYYDSTGITGSIVKQILYEKGINAKPFPFYEKAKEKILNALKSAATYNQPVFENDRLIAGVEGNWGRLRIPRIQVLIDELLTYTYPNDKRLQKDCVMALAGAVYIAERVYKYNQSMKAFKESRGKELWFLQRKRLLGE